MFHSQWVFLVSSSDGLWNIVGTVFLRIVRVWHKRMKISRFWLWSNVLRNFHHAGRRRLGRNRLAIFVVFLLSLLLWNLFCFLLCEITWNQLWNHFFYSLLQFAQSIFKALVCLIALLFWSVSCRQKLIKIFYWLCWEAVS